MYCLYIITIYDPVCRYNGSLDGAKGLWIGVQYDEPRGKNDGS